MISSSFSARAFGYSLNPIAAQGVSNGLAELAQVVVPAIRCRPSLSGAGAPDQRDVQRMQSIGVLIRPTLEKSLVANPGDSESSAERGQRVRDPGFARYDCAGDE